MHNDSHPLYVMLIKIQQVDQLIDRLLAICHDPATQNQPLNLRFAFRSLALDVITAYCFGSSLGCLTYPDRPSDPQAKLDFKHPVLASVGDHLSHLWLFKWFPIIRIAAQNLPKIVVKRLDPITRANAELGWAMQKQIDDFVDAQKDGNAGKLKDVDHDLIFHRLLTIGRDPTESNTVEPLSKVSILGEVSDCTLQVCNCADVFGTEQALRGSRLRHRWDQLIHWHVPCVQQPPNS